LKVKDETPRVEDYLEIIYRLIKEKGYASASDISERLEVKRPTASLMIAKLAKMGYLKHEKYRGIVLTQQGEKVARSVIKKHEIIAEFLEMLGVDKKTAYMDTEGIEHHVQAETLERLRKTAEYFKRNRKALNSLRRFIEPSKDVGLDNLGWIKRFSSLKVKNE
jgi:Mn-dependent DtxR family transcriptional regulator